MYICARRIFSSFDKLNNTLDTETEGQTGPISSSVYFVAIVNFIHFYMLAYTINVRSYRYNATTLDLYNGFNEIP